VAPFRALLLFSDVLSKVDIYMLWICRNIIECGNIIALEEHKFFCMNFGGQLFLY